MSKPLKEGQTSAESIYGVEAQVEEVSKRLGTDPSLVGRAFVVREGGFYKLVIPGETEDKSPVVALSLAEGQLKTTHGLETKLRKAVTEAGYSAEAGEVMAAVAVKLMSELYAFGKIEKNPGPQGGYPTGSGFIEDAQMTMLRPFTLVTERGRQAALDISSEGWESMVLNAMARNDGTRMSYLARQAAESLGTVGALGIDSDWKRLYVQTMIAKMGPGNYPALESRQGLELFMKEVYMPVVALILSSAEVASTMGDHQATVTTADLKKQMEIILAERRAEAEEKVQPARARAENARVTADATIAAQLKKSGDVLAVGKRLRAELAARTIASPIFHALAQIVEAGSEATPAFYKGFAEYLKRWLDQQDVDPKLVGTTTGGLALGIVLSIALANPLWMTIPLVSASGYMAWKGFRTTKQ